MWLDLNTLGIFLGIQNNLKILGSADCIYSSCYIMSSFLEIFKAWKLGMGISWGLIFGPGIFLGFV